MNINYLWVKTSKKYVEIWQKHLPIIVSLLKKALSDNQTKEYKLPQQEFEAVGNRKKTGYSFRLHFVNGKIINNLKHSAVARDLATVLNEDTEIKSLLKNKSILLRLTHAFYLNITSTL